MNSSARPAQKAISFTSMQSLLLSLVGVDLQILSKNKKHLASNISQFYSEGICVGILILLAILSGGIFLYLFLAPSRLADYGEDVVVTLMKWIAVVIGALLSGLYVMNLQKFIIFCRNGISDKKITGLKQYGRWAFAIVFSMLCGFMIAIPLQIALFDSEIKVAYRYELHREIDSEFERISKSYQPYFREIYQVAYEDKQAASFPMRPQKPITKSMTSPNGARERGIRVDNLSLDVKTLNPSTGRYESQAQSNIETKSEEKHINAKKDSSQNLLGNSKSTNANQNKLADNHSAKNIDTKNLKNAQHSESNKNEDKNADELIVKNKDTTTSSQKENGANIPKADLLAKQSAKEGDLNSENSDSSLQQSNVSPFTNIMPVSLFNLNEREQQCYKNISFFNKFSNFELFKSNLVLCLHDLDATLGVKSSQLNLLERDKSDPDAQLDLKIDLLSLKMQKDKLLALLRSAPNPGLIKASTIAFEEFGFFSWLLILSIVFIQTMPILMKVFGSRNAYDYLVDERMRLSLAENAGIEYRAYEIYDGKNAPVYKTLFHQVLAIRSTFIHEINKLKKNLSETRMELMRVKFDAIQKRVKK